MKIAFIKGGEKMKEETKKAIERCVRIRSRNIFGTGVVVAKNLVLACYHEKDEEVVLEDGSKVEPFLIVGNDVGKIVAFDAELDLMLISAETQVADPVEFAKGVELDDEIYSVGCPLDHEKLIVHGRIVRMTENLFYSDLHAIYGSSGSGVYTEDGRFLSIVEAVSGQKGFGFPFTAIHNPESVREFLGRIQAQPPS